MGTKGTFTWSVVVLLGVICVTGSNTGYYRIYEKDDPVTSYIPVCLPQDSVQRLPKCSSLSARGTDFDLPTCDTKEFRNELKDVCHENEISHWQRNPQCPIPLRKPFLCVILGNDAACFSCLKSIHWGCWYGEVTFTLSAVICKGGILLEYGHTFVKKDVPKDQERGPFCQFVRFAAVIVFVVLACIVYFSLSNKTADKHNRRNREPPERTLISRILQRYRVSIAYTKLSLLGACHALVLLVQRCRLGIHHAFMVLAHGVRHVFVRLVQRQLGIYHAIVIPVQRLLLDICQSLVFLIQRLSLGIYHIYVFLKQRLLLGIYHIYVFLKRLQQSTNQICVLSMRGLTVAWEVTIAYLLPFLGIYLELPCGCLPRCLRTPVVVVNHGATSEYSFRHFTCCVNRLPKQSVQVVSPGASSENVFA